MSIDSTVLEEELDTSYEPTDEEVAEYATWLGFDLPQEKQLLWIARNGLQARLPPEWKPCRTEEDEIYYFNFDTGESTWDHPCDAMYRNFYKDEAEKLKLQQHQMSPPKEQVIPLRAANGVNEDSPKAGVTMPDQENSGRLVIRWKSALTGSEQKDDAEEKRAEPVGRLNVANLEQNVQTQTAKLVEEQARLLDEMYKKHRDAMLREIEKRIGYERKLLQDKDIKQLERELEREHEFLDIQERQRLRMWESKIKLDQEMEFKMEAELLSRKHDREVKYKSIVSQEIDSFEAVRREKLASYRRNLVEKELQEMQLEKEAMARRISEAVQEYEKVATGDIKAGMLERVKSATNAFKVKTAQAEFHEQVSRVQERVRVEGERLKDALEKNVEAEMVRLKEQLLVQKRQEMLREVDVLAAELKSDVERTINIIRKASERREKNVAVEPEAHMEECGTLMGRDTGSFKESAESPGSQETDAGLANAVQKFAFEMLLNLLTKDGRRQGCGCCDEKHLEMKSWMTGLERKLKKIVLVLKEDTRQALSNLRLQLDRDCTALAGRSSCHVLMCDSHSRPCCHGRHLTPTTGCMSERNLHARDPHAKICLNRERSPVCSCDYDGCRKQRMMDRIRGEWKLDVDTDSDSGTSEPPVSRTRKCKQARSTSKDMKSKHYTGSEWDTMASTNSSLQISGRTRKECKTEDIRQEAISNCDDPGQSSLSSTYCSCNSHSLETRRLAGKRSKLNKTRKGLFVLKGKLLRWSRTPASRRTVYPGIKKSDIAKIQLECRKKLRQLPVGIRWKVARLSRGPPRSSNRFCATAEGWPSLDIDSRDFLNDHSPESFA